MKIGKITTYSLLGGMGFVTITAIMASSVSASPQIKSDISGAVSEKSIIRKVHHQKAEGLLEIFGLNREEYIELLRDDISLREYAESESIDLEEITSEAESRMIDRLDDALESGKITEEEYDEKLNSLSLHIEAQLDAEDLEDLPGKHSVFGGGRLQGMMQKRK